jgi:hypothetical protein
MGLCQKLSIKSDDFTPSPEFLKFSELAPPPGAKYLGEPCLKLIEEQKLKLLLNVQII